MHIHIVPNRGSPPTVLLRESYREGSKVRKRTLANLSSLSAEQVEAIRAVLAGQAMQPAAQALEITASRSHGHVQAVTLTMQRLGMASLLASKPCRERELVLAMIASPSTSICRQFRTAHTVHHHHGSPPSAVWPTPEAVVAEVRSRAELHRRRIAGWAQAARAALRH